MALTPDERARLVHWLEQTAQELAEIAPMVDVVFRAYLRKGWRREDALEMAKAAQAELVAQWLEVYRRR